MKISEQWLREWVDAPGDTAALAEQLTMAGLEVDGIEPAAPPLDGVVVGRVVEKVQHPNADRLSVCTVDVGGDAPLQIVCGATNVYAGGTFPVATVGTTLPGDFKIKKSKLRGELSQGMLCSGVELGISEEAEGLLELDGALLPGTAIDAALGLNDSIIEVDLTPNRADCFSMLGVARDMAAFNTLPFSEPVVDAIASTVDDTLDIALAPDAGCPAFAGRVIRGINPAAESPLWLVERLRRAGIRALHPVVDVTNFVMLELGQPMHGYDLAKLQGGIGARPAAPGEEIELLDGRTVKLEEDVLVIADAAGAVGMAGIMGGLRTAVGATTTDVFLESAFFSPAAMAGRARRYGLHTDASLRFERGVDFTQQVRAIERATALITDIAGGSAGPVIDRREPAALPARPAVSLRADRLERLLGISVPADEVAAMFQRLGFVVEGMEGGWKVTPTPSRFDIAIEADLIEEVVRLYGYDQVTPARLAGAPQLATASESRVDAERAADLLADRGYAEAITYSFVDPAAQSALLGDADELALANPISGDLAVMRRSLWTGLLDAAAANRKRQQDRVRLFESGSIFVLQESEIKEEKMIAGVALGRATPEHWSDGKEASRATDFFDVKADVEALLNLTSGPSADYVTSEHPALRPGRTARIERAGAVIGWLGELHPRIARRNGLAPAPVLFALQATEALRSAVPAYRAVSRFPSVRRDLAVVVPDEVEAAELVRVAREAAGALLREIKVFDVYRGGKIEKGLKSVALGLILQETSRTLTEPEIEGAVSAVIKGLSGQLNASIRE